MKASIKTRIRFFDGLPKRKLDRLHALAHGSKESVMMGISRTPNPRGENDSIELVLEFNDYGSFGKFVKAMNKIMVLSDNPKKK